MVGSGHSVVLQITSYKAEELLKEVNAIRIHKVIEDHCAKILVIILLESHYDIFVC